MVFFPATTLLNIQASPIYLRKPQPKARLEPLTGSSSSCPSPSPVYLLCFCCTVIHLFRILILFSRPGGRKILKKSLSLSTILFARPATRVEQRSDYWYGNSMSRQSGDGLSTASRLRWIHRTHSHESLIRQE